MLLNSLLYIRMQTLVKVLHLSLVLLSKNIISICLHQSDYQEVWVGEPLNKKLKLYLILYFVLEGGENLIPELIVSSMVIFTRGRGF